MPSSAPSDDRIPSLDGLRGIDDIRWPDGMKKAWAEVSADRHVVYSADLGDIGVCVTHPNPTGGKSVEFGRTL